ncbi:GNAT family N-acetyltransferase [Jiulongibacter sp. NS-SX5]|uniref:GNAT family N-acetyltransferase n=1 Tax=Jiulongibacter sp. NS-SX5 TaxID=3463854 RepID=UPI004059DFB0
MEVKIARSRQELQEVRDLRYAVNFKELKKNYLLEEAESKDEHAVHLMAVQQQKPLGCLRCRFTTSNTAVNYKWGISSTQENLTFAITDRLVILPEYRNSRAAYLLMMSIYKQALIHGAKIALIECEKHLVPMYKRLGFMPYREQTYAYGLRVQLYINPWDQLTLASLGSPFTRIYQEYMAELNALSLTIRA